MNIYEGLVIGTFVMCAIIMISQYIDSAAPTVGDVIQLMHIIPCYDIKAYKNGKLLGTSELIQNINSAVKAHQMNEGILYIEIY